MFKGGCVGEWWAGEVGEHSCGGCCQEWRRAAALTLFHLELMECEKMWTDCCVIEFLGSYFISHLERFSVGLFPRFVNHNFHSCGLVCYISPLHDVVVGDVAEWNHDGVSFLSLYELFFLVLFALNPFYFASEIVIFVRGWGKGALWNIYPLWQMAKILLFNYVRSSERAHMNDMPGEGWSKTETYST